uniref:B30.2/SPRY domain-containing protein n=1 Tax=Kalmanozyma brasiliensis (strain GHG001) TaxID=1365824 RepID=V5ESX9_KALBG
MDIDDPLAGQSSPGMAPTGSLYDVEAGAPTNKRKYQDLSHHALPDGYRGPPLRKNDSEDFAPAPHLAPTVGSSTLFNTVNFAVNRNGWRYTAAGPSSQQLPQTVFKTLETRPANVHWCWSDRSPFTKISADADIISTDKGFRGARTNIGVREGEWYTEIEILPPEHLAHGVGAAGPLPGPMKDGAHIRLGWGRREAPVNAPVGFDGYSYGLRDKGGDKVTLSRPLPYGKPFKAGDVVGMYIKLPPHTPPQDENDPANIKRERIAIRYKGQLYFESLEYPRTREMEQLMERSRKGNSIEEALQGIEGTGVFEPQATKSLSDSAEGVNGVAGAANGNGSSAATASAGGAGGGGSAKVKNRKNPGTKEKPSGPTTPSLRPLPKLLGSKIGFFVNGEPQGIAFEDLFDFRPLRVKGFSGLKPAPAKSSSRPTKQDAAKKGDATEPIINVKARENVFDDGALGYFPFVSSYGGAKARLITGENGFRFPPPDNIEAALENVIPSSSSSTNIKQEGATQGGRTWKPLSARFEEHLAEMWAHDLQDEVKAQLLADKKAEEKAIEDQKEAEKAQRNKARYAAGKKKHAAALARAAAGPAPLHDDEGDRTVTGMDVDDVKQEWDASNGGSIQGTPAPPTGVGMEEEDVAHRESTEPGTPPLLSNAEHGPWSSSRSASPEDQIRLVQSSHHTNGRDEEDVEMHDDASRPN